MYNEGAGSEQQDMDTTENEATLHLIRDQLIAAGYDDGSVDRVIGWAIGDLEADIAKRKDEVAGFEAARARGQTGAYIGRTVILSEIIPDRQAKIDALEALRTYHITHQAH